MDDNETVLVSERSVRENKPSVEFQQRNEEDRDQTLQDID